MRTRVSARGEERTALSLSHLLGLFIALSCGALMMMVLA